MKRILALVLMMAMCLGMFVLVGCDSGSGKHEASTQRPADSENETQVGEDTDNGGTSTQPKPLEYDVVAYDGSAVTITFSHTMNATYRGVLDQYIAKFNEMYPNITVEHAQIGGYDEVRDQIKTELTAGNQPNIAYCYPDHVALYNVAKAVVPLNSFIDSTIKVTDAQGNETVLGLTEEQVNDFIPGFYKEGAAFDNAGTMYTLPMSKSTEALYYNKTAFDNWAKKYAETGDEKYNIKVPTTWDEMEEVCKKIKALDPKSIPLGYDSEANWFITMTEQYKSGYTSATGNHYLFDNKTNREFVERFARWHSEGLMTTQELNGGYTSSLFVNQDPTQPKSYMSIGSSAGATHQRPDKVDGEYPFEVGITSIPQVNPNDPKVISQGPSLVLLDTGDTQENIAAWLLMRFLTTDVELQAEFANASGYVPVLKSVTEVPTFKAKLDNANGGDNIAYLSLKVCLAQDQYYYTSPAFNGSSTARDQVGALMKYCMENYTTYKNAGNVDKLIDEAFKNAINECESQL